MKIHIQVNGQQCVDFNIGALGNCLRDLGHRVGPQESVGIFSVLMRDWSPCQLPHSSDLQHQYLISVCILSDASQEETERQGGAALSGGMMFLPFAVPRAPALPLVFTPTLLFFSRFLSLSSSSSPLLLSSPLPACFSASPSLAPCFAASQPRLLCSSHCRLLGGIQ